MNPFNKLKLFKSESAGELANDTVSVQTMNDAIEMESLGVGAAMPQDITDFIFAADIGRSVHYA